MKNFFKNLGCLLGLCEKFQVGTMSLRTNSGDNYELVVRMCPLCEGSHYYLVPATITGKPKRISKIKAEMFMKSYGNMQWEKKPIFVYN